jgi:hypothetical protein
MEKLKNIPTVVAGKFKLEKKIGGGSFGMFSILLM